MPRAGATARWRGRASIPTSSYRGRPDGWASWKASPRSKRSAATTRRSPKTRPRSTRCADYEHQLDARFAAARGFVDAVVLPEETRETLAFLLETTGEFTGPHLGAFVLSSQP